MTRFRLRRLSQLLAARRHTVVVPLLEPEHTLHALELACRLASDRGSRVLLLAPLPVEWELPLDAHFKAEEAALRVELERTRALAESYGARVQAQVVRARPGQLGSGVAAAASDAHASLVVLGAQVDSRPGSRRPFSRDIWSVLNDSPCPVMVTTGAGPRAGRAVA